MFPEKFIPNEEEMAKINEIRKLIGPAANKFPCDQFSDASILRFLRARNHNTRRAAKMMKETLKWRHKYKPEMIRWDDIAHQAKTGKLYRANYSDKYGRTVLVMRPGCQSESSVEDQIKCLVYCLESAISNLHEGQEQMVWLIDFRTWNMSSISVKVTRETARVLQDHYPERLGIAVLYNPPKVFESFWMMVKPFLEPKTYMKVRFVYSDQPQTMKVMEALFDMDKLETAFGGKNMENFEIEVYAKRMKDEEERKPDHSDQASNTSELQNSDFLIMSDASSELSKEADSSSKYEVGSHVEMTRVQLGCNNEADDMLDCQGKTKDANEVKKVKA